MSKLHRSLIIGLILRVVFLLTSFILDRCFHNHSFKVLPNQALASAICNVNYTLQNLREGIFLAKQLNGGNGVIYGAGAYSCLYESDHSTFFHLPPLLLVLPGELILFITKVPFVQDLLFSLFMIMIDLALALALYELAERLLLLKPPDLKKDDTHTESNLRKNVILSEEILEQRMNSRIRPPKAWVFGITFLSDKSTVGLNNNNLGREFDVIATTNVHDEKDAIISMSNIPKACCIYFFLNPISILTSCSKEMISFQNLLSYFLVLAFLEVNRKPKKDGNNRKGSTSHLRRAMLYLSIVSYVEIYHVVFLVPIILMANNSTDRKEFKCCIMTCSGYFIIWSLSLQILSLTLVGWKNYPSMLRQTYYRMNSFEDLNPNLGMFWYLFIQMFGRFRQWFVIIMAGLPFTFVIPTIFRMHRYPIDITSILYFIWTIFKPTSTLVDLVFSTSLLFMSPRTVARMSSPGIIAVLALPIPIALYIMDYWTWLVTGTGNANYMFFQCLAYSIFLAVIFTNFMSASVKREKALQLTAKFKLKEKESKVLST